MYIETAHASSQSHSINPDRHRPKPNLTGGRKLCSTWLA